MGQNPEDRYPPYFGANLGYVGAIVSTIGSIISVIGIAIELEQEMIADAKSEQGQKATDKVLEDMKKQIQALQKEVEEAKQSPNETQSP